MVKNSKKRKIAGPGVKLAAPHLKMKRLLQSLIVVPMNATANETIQHLWYLVKGNSHKLIAGDEKIWAAYLDHDAKMPFLRKSSVDHCSDIPFVPWKNYLVTFTPELYLPMRSYEIATNIKYKTNNL